MVKVLLFGFFRVIIFPTNRSYIGDLVPYYSEASKRSDFQFSHYFEFNTELLETIKALPPTPVRCLITAASLHILPEVKPILDPVFSKVYSLEKLGMRKTDPEAYQPICSDQMVAPSEVIFIDDNLNCLQSAGSVGLITLPYLSNSQTISDLTKLLTTQ